MFWTRFEPDDEARFRARFAERSIPFLRFALPVAIIVYLFFLFWDYAVNPVDLGTTLAIRLYFCVLAIVAFGFTYLRFFRRWMQAIMCGTVILGATGIILAVFLVPEGFRIGTSAILIAVMFACGLARLLFWSAFVACAAIIGITNGLLFVHEASAFDYFNTNFFIVVATIIGLTYAGMLEAAERHAFVVEGAERDAKRRTAAILRRLFPARIADKVREGEDNIAESFSEGIVMVADIAGFTDLSQHLAPGHAVEILGGIFGRLDEIARRKEIESVRTFGERYIAVGGVQKPYGRGVETLAEFAIEARGAVERYLEERDLPLRIRIGLASGPMISGVVRSSVPVFESWGEMLDTSVRLATEAPGGTIQVSESVYWRLRQNFEFEERETITLSGERTVTAYVLTGRKIISLTDRQAPPGS